MPGRLAPPVRHAAKSPQRRAYRHAGTVRLRLSRRGCACCTLSRPPPPIRTAERLRKAPLVDRGAGIIQPLRWGVRNFFLSGPGTGCAEAARFSAEPARVAE